MTHIYGIAAALVGLAVAYFAVLAPIIDKVQHLTAVLPS